MQKRISWLNVKDWRNILCAFLIVVIIILIVLTPIYWYLDHMFVSNEIRRYEAALSKSSEELSRVVTGINYSIYFTQKSNAFISLRWKSEMINPVTLAEQQSTWKGYIIQQNAIASAGLVFSPDLAVTTSWIFYPGVAVKFYPDMFRCEDLSFDEWCAKLRGSFNNFLPEAAYSSSELGGKLHAITYSALWGNNGILYALIPVDKLLDMFLTDDLHAHGGLQLTNAKGETLFAYGVQDDSDAITISSQTAIGGVSIKVLVPNSLLNQRLHELRWLVFIYLLVVLFIVITVTLLFGIFATSKPLNSLSKQLTSPYRKNDRNRSPQSNYNILSEGISSMNQTIISQRQTIMRQYLDVALLRGFLSSEEEKRFLDEIPDFPFQYRLILYRLSEDSPIDALNDMLEICTGTFQNSIVHLIDHNAVLVVMDTNRNHREKAARLLENMQLNHLPVTGTVSDLLSGVSALHSGWVQLTEIECFIQDGQTDRLRNARDLPEKRIILPLSFQDLQTVYSALCACNLSLALSILSNCTYLLMKQEDNKHLYYHTFLMLHQMLRQIQMENPHLPNTLGIPVFSKQNRNELFAVLLPACFERIVNAIRSSRTSANRSGADEMLSYIKANLGSADLCVDGVASHFGISSTTLQKLCKEATGRTVASYIEQNRLALAYKLLSETDNTIAQVAEKCGFNSPNSFYKSFKRHFGTAPRAISESKIPEP